MKKKLLYFLAGIAVLVGGYLVYRKINSSIETKKHQARVAKMAHTASKNVQILTDTIPIHYLNEQRTLAIYLPEGYALDSSDYSVLYFLDGQSLFDQKIQEGTEWELDEVLDSLGRIFGQQSIIVGLYNSENRSQEYKPFPDGRWYGDKSFGGPAHADWIVNTVKPWVDERFRTKKDTRSTIIGGASFGGIMSYYMLMKYPSVFGGAIVFSPSFWLNEDVFTLQENNPHLSQQRIYFNAGELEPSTIANMLKMKNILLQSGMPSENIKSDVEAGLGHSHSTWRNGFRKAYPWILGSE